MRYFDSLRRIDRLSRDTRGVTIVELMIVLAILAMGITALLQTIGGGINYTRDTENNIKAINIAREGIEGVTNIRDTNWLRFSSDKVNCWKVDAYDSGCIGVPGFSRIIGTGSSILYSTNGVWFLSGITSAPPYNTAWDTYKNLFQVNLDANGYFSQSGVMTNTCSSFLQKNCKSIFSREITIDIPPPGTDTGVLLIKSIVRWYDGRYQNVTLDTTLTNWKSKF